MNNIILLLVFFALIYFMMIRPQQKQQKKRREMLEQLRTGDQIITIGGLHGRIKALRDNNVVCQVADGVDITILKTAVGQVINENDDDEGTAEETVTDEENK